MSPEHPLSVAPLASHLSRRDVLALAGGLGASLLLLPRRSLATAAETVKAETWADVVALGERVWGVVSKPLDGDFKTLCNGGLVAGRERVLAVDAYAGDEGSKWASDMALALAGRRPTDVVVTHFHGDHAGGLAGYAAAGEAPRIWITPTTRDLLGKRGAPPEILEGAALLSEESATEIDLGGRSVTIEPLLGHTPSDVAVRTDSGVLFWGDLVWNRMFPNYVDAIPSALGKSVRKAMEGDASAWVPGHGPLPARSDLDLFLTLIDDIEAAARRAHQAGISAAEAAKSYQLPAAVAEWRLFNPNYFQVAIAAWHKELG